MSALTVHYQWLKDGTPIDGATDARYTTVHADIGSTLTVQLTTSAIGYLPGTYTTAPSKTVAVSPGC